MSSSGFGVSSTACRVKGDITWAHVSESVDDNGRKMLKCLYCGKTTREGGIYRMKQHLARKKGDVDPCTKVPHDVRFQMANALEEIVAKNKEKQEFRRHATPFGATIPPFEGDIAVEEFEGLSPPMNMTEGNTGIRSSKKQIRLTNDSKRKRPIGVGDFFAPRTTSGAQPSIKSVLAGKEAKWRADMAVVRFLYDTCIPLNALNSIYFQPMLDVITAIGPGYKQPTYYEARVNLLNDSKKEVQLLIDSYRKNWEEVGCTLMADGWTDISSIIVKVVGPLMRLLRIVDSDERPSLGYVYDGMTLRRGIHAAAYYLNPAFQYDRESFCTKPEVLQGFLDVVESKTYEWWRTYGYSTPNLQKFAIKILSQTSTSSGCERNWSVFERIHTKKRNRLEHQRVNDLVFIHYNLQLQNR
ncbi:uncharacterized protein LOC123192118 [Mangifera indica]|uniref:uncharacterized protein LOC123192118 n=1 Tax=Mangifera indica TaxID=29780 RepID=UPI001CF96E88|nr:uncharacterized protein LOC123192118 [Mangifera indica]